MVAQHLRAWIAYSRGKYELYFWRTQAGSEVDFIVYGEDSFWAVEVKNTAQVDRKELRSLKSFRDDYPEAEALLLYRGNERLWVDDVWCLPAEEFMTELKPDRGLTGWLS